MHVVSRWAVVIVWEDMRRAWLHCEMCSIVLRSRSWVEWSLLGVVAAMKDCPSVPLRRHGLECICSACSKYEQQRGMGVECVCSTTCGPMQRGHDLGSRDITESGVGDRGGVSQHIPSRRLGVDGIF